jgi:hypothetical protein
LPYPDVVRAKIVLMAAEGLDHHKIAAHLDTRREAVSKWPRRWEASRVPRPDGVPGGGQSQLGSSGRDQAPGQGLAPNASDPYSLHSSWLNQVQIYVSICQRKVLTPNNFADLTTVEQCLLAFERRCGQTAKPLSGVHPCRPRHADQVKRLSEKDEQPKRRRAARNT